MRTTLLLLLAASSLGAQQRPPAQNGALPFVSPDGKWISFVANRDGKQPGNLFVIGSDGANERQLTAAGGSIGRWTADSKSLYFVVPQMGMRAESVTVMTVAVTGGTSKQSVRVTGNDPVLSPDGKLLLTSAGGFGAMKLTATPAGGGVSRDLTDGKFPAFNGVWSPDGKRIAFARLDPTPRGQAPRDMQLWVMNADGSDAKQLTHFEAADGFPQWPSWSPDGHRIAVQAGTYSREGPNSAHIWIVDAHSGAATKLAAHDKPYLDETPSFFPDGKRIAFQSDRTGRMEIWVMNVDGTNARQITK